ncbi:hypothetical protein FISHEDRAFT_74273 [Fistulina hepatica ATCC 64428]|uniref:Uncharacterized protein n=1 Tax=Fistulina hepatica ATCC 64428 TaxID=1128425 RepID=A0A0D7AD50_9AGAR|nr:hypothetical protein FISHEDRAFT_74273 [Fistulina hepatica ATCC 64428]
MTATSISPRSRPPHLLNSELTTSLCANVLRNPNPLCTHRTKIMDSATTAARGAHTTAKSVCDIDDWEDLKDLLQMATEQYEHESAIYFSPGWLSDSFWATEDDDAEAVPLLGGVIHECH